MALVRAGLRAQNSPRSYSSASEPPDGGCESIFESFLRSRRRQELIGSRRGHAERAGRVPRQNEGRSVRSRCQKLPLPRLRLSS